MATLAQMVERFGAKYGIDGYLARLIEAGFTCIRPHAGGRGWKEIDGRVCWVDSWGGAWAEPQGAEVSWQETKERGRAAGAVSMDAVLKAAALAQK